MINNFLPPGRFRFALAEDFPLTGSKANKSFAPEIFRGKKSAALAEDFPCGFILDRLFLGGGLFLAGKIALSTCLFCLVPTRFSAKYSFTPKALKRILTLPLKRNYPLRRVYSCAKARFR
jgi:hypothetical protein